MLHMANFCTETCYFNNRKVDESKITITNHPIQCDRTRSQTTRIVGAFGAGTGNPLLIIIKKNVYDNY